MNVSSSKKALGGLVLAGAVMLTGIVGFAQQQTTTPGQSGQGERAEEGRRGGRKGWDGAKRGGRGFGAFAKLNLTDAQKEQMKQIAARYRESNKALREQTHGRRGADFGATGAFDEAAVRAEAQKRAAARVEMDGARARMMSEMYAVLTAEQKAQLAAWRAEREQKRQERRARRDAARQGQSQ